MNNTFSKTLSIVLPVFNEEACIEGVISDLYKEILDRFQDYELIVVNDGSQDRTKAKLDDLKTKYKGLIVIHQERQGHGRAIMEGYKKAIKDWIFQMDSDDQYEVEDFWKLWEAQPSPSIVLGSRKNRQDMTARLIITRLLRIFILILFGYSIPDSNIPFRLFERKIFMDISTQMPEGTIIPNVFLSILFCRAGYHPVSIAVSHKDRKTGKANLSRWKLMLFCTHSIKEVLRFRFL